MQRRYHSGWREDLGVKVRSGWEATVLRILTHQGVQWQYEPQRFDFPIKRGTRSYTPDIFLPEKDIWLEIKGYLQGTDKTRIRRFRKYYPEEYAKLHAIPASPTSEAAKFFDEMNIPIYGYYHQLVKQFKDILPDD